MHLTDERIQRLLHGELAEADEADGRAHVAGCRECRSRLAAAEREERLVLEHLRHLDHPPPRVEAEAVANRARRPRLDYRWAAGILVALAAAGGAYAFPGSPLPSLLDRVGAWLGTASRSAPTVEAPAGDSMSGGVAVAPGERATLVIDDGGVEVVVRVRLIDGPDIVVRTVRGVASFTTGIDRLTVTTGDVDTHLAVELPRTAPWVEIRADGRRVLLKDGTRVVTDVPAGEDGVYVLRLEPVRR